MAAPGNGERSIRSTCGVGPPPCGTSHAVLMHEACMSRQLPQPLRHAYPYHTYILLISHLPALMTVELIAAARSAGCTLALMALRRCMARDPDNRL